MAKSTSFDDVRICVLDDNRNFQNLMRTLLRAMGFRRVDVFTDPAVARSFVVDTPVDIAFVDLIMAGENGIDWVRHIRRSSLLANPVMPIALVTGMVDRRVVDAAIAAGVDDVMVKPLSPTTLHRHTTRLLHHPTRYVRGPDGYFGPDLRGTSNRTERLDPSVAGRRTVPDQPRLFRTLPGLHVAIHQPTVYDGEQTFLD